jgi:arsenite methyltransferase
MTRYLRLGLAEHFDQVADTDLLIAHEIQQPKPGLVAKRLKEEFDIEDCLFHGHGTIIYALTNILFMDIVALTNMFVEATMSEQLMDSVRAKYGAVAESSLSTEHAGVKAVAEAFGYSAEELTSIPSEANMGLSCGNPTATAFLKPGEVVVDLGSGGGLDVFLASKKVGPTGRAIGIDMTPAMIERAQANAKTGSYENVEFHLATIDHLPLADSSVDCVISNCVINLAPDKPAVFREIARVLKPGGRLAISDIALKAELSQQLAQSLAAYVGCIAGAIRIEDYRKGLLAAGFEHVEIVDSGADLNAYAKVENQSGCCSPAMDTTSAFPVLPDACCTPAPAASLHEELTSLLSQYDVNAAAASVKVYAIKPRS